MAVRPDDLTSKAIIKTYTVAASQTATKGLGVILSGADDTVDDAGANGEAIGIALQTKAAGEQVEVALLGYAIVPVKVGTGAATRGKYAIMAADGFTDQTLGGGTTVKYVAGKFMQSGIAGDIVGLLLGNFASGAA